MIFTNTIWLILALAPATLFAAPTQVADSIANLLPRQDLPKAVIDELKKTNGLCDLSNVVLPIGMSALTPMFDFIDANKPQHQHLFPRLAKTSHSATSLSAAAHKTTPAPHPPQTSRPLPTAPLPRSSMQHVTLRASTTQSWPTSLAWRSTTLSQLVPKLSSVYQVTTSSQRRKSRSSSFRLMP